MAAASDEDANGGLTTAAARYCLVSGIPAALRSAQLRAYFSQFMEAGGFLCFHYRHRPERPPGEEAAAPRTCCCPVALRPGRVRRFICMYSGKCWVGPGGTSVPGRCLIRRIRLSPGTGTETLPCSGDETAAAESVTEGNLKRLPEFNPPSFMPYGNVGTPLKVFLELIRTCRLPPQVIKKLQLDFPKTGSSRRYGNVPFEYQHTETVIEEERVYTATGDEITEEEEPVARPEVTQPAGAEEDEEGQDKEEEEESHSDDDDDTCEEWERHEALHEDVTKQDRTEERLFEEEIELKWEKGGSGLVFYTDAQYWQQQNGDFDEQTADDWDVDMSIYYDRDGGDKDARDSVRMWLEQRLRDGLEDGSASGHQIGSFERHTRGFGRKVLEQQGWTEGLGLGSSNSGMAEALDNEGQNPRCKRGLGYHGEKLPTFMKKKPRRDSPILISTVYDAPDPKDSGDQLLRRQPPTAMKYRQEMPFVRASHGALKSFGAQS
ncbi:GPTC3 protein, partial [Rhinopomastus cyanomelas]|nr:GPTC3 protein [Rhinopomastus cyanomelas]